MKGLCHGDCGSPNLSLPLPMYTKPGRIGTCRRASFARFGRDEVGEVDAACCGLPIGGGDGVAWAVGGGDRRAGGGIGGEGSVGGDTGCKAG